MIRQLFSEHRLFWKIMLIFWLTTILTIIANVLITREIVVNEFKVEQLRDKMRTLAIEATASYENNGKKGLRLWYHELVRREGIRVVLLDEQKKPIVRVKKSHHENHNKERYGSPLNRPHLLNLADQSVVSASGNHYILRVLPSRYIYSKFNPEALHKYRLSASFIIILLGSLWIARSIAKPIRLLREASESISQGELNVRVSPMLGKRKDELGQLAKTFDQMINEINSLINNQKQLFRDISHEIRTPLTRQKLAIELARSSDKPTPLLDKIEHQNEIIETLIEQLLSFIQSNHDDTNSKKDQIDIYQLLNHICNDAALELDKKHLCLQRNIANEAEVLGDPTLLTRAIENLLINAIKYAPEESEITVHSILKDKQYYIEITDEGKGIPEHELGSILRPFYRADKSRNRETGGFGLGLAISSSIINKHGGHLQLENRHPNGLRVRIILPLITP